MTKHILFQGQMNKYQVSWKLACNVIKLVCSCFKCKFRSHFTLVNVKWKRNMSIIRPPRRIHTRRGNVALYNIQHTATVDSFMSRYCYTCFTIACIAGLVVTRSPLTAATRVQYPASACEMVMWSPSQTGGFLPVLQFPPTRRPPERKHRCQRLWLI